MPIRKTSPTRRASPARRASPTRRASAPAIRSKKYKPRKRR